MSRRFLCPEFVRGGVKRYMSPLLSCKAEAVGFLLRVRAPGAFLAGLCEGDRSPGRGLPPFDTRRAYPRPVSPPSLRNAVSPQYVLFFPRADFRLVPMLAPCRCGCWFVFCFSLIDSSLWRKFPAFRVSCVGEVLRFDAFRLSLLEGCGQRVPLGRGFRWIYLHLGVWRSTSSLHPRGDSVGLVSLSWPSAILLLLRQGRSPPWVDHLPPCSVLPLFDRPSRLSI